MLDFAVGGVSHVEMLLLSELWAGERLVLEKALPRYRGPGRPISVSAVQALKFGDRVDSLGLLCDLLCTVPGGNGRLFPVGLGPIIVGYGILDVRSVGMKGDCLGGLSS